MSGFGSAGDVFWFLLLGAWFLYVTVIGIIALRKSSAGPGRWSLVERLKAVSLLVFVLSFGYASAIINVAFWVNSLPTWVLATPVRFWLAEGPMHPMAISTAMTSAVISNGVVLYAFRDRLLDWPIDAVRAMWGDLIFGDRHRTRISDQLDLPSRRDSEGFR